MAKQRFKVRNFERFFGAGEGRPMVKFEGRVEGERFVVSVIGQQVGLAAFEVGEDQWGPYAFIQEEEVPLSHGFRFEACVNYEEDEEPGGALRIFLEGPLRENVRQHMVDQGVDPDAVMLLVPPKRALTVYFNSFGIVDGDGSAGGDAPATQPTLN